MRLRTSCLSQIPRGTASLHGRVGSRRENVSATSGPRSCPKAATASARSSTVVTPGPRRLASDPDLLVPPVRGWLEVVGTGAAGPAHQADADDDEGPGRGETATAEGPDDEDHGRDLEVAPYPCEVDGGPHPPALRGGRPPVGEGPQRAGPVRG